MYYMINLFLGCVVNCSVLRVGGQIILKDRSSKAKVEGGRISMDRYTVSGNYEGMMIRFLSFHHNLLY